MKTRNLILLLLLISNLAARAVTKVYVQDITVTAGSEFEVPISLNTDLTDIDLIEGTIIFPSQMMVIDDAYGTNKRVSVDESRASGSWETIIPTRTPSNCSLSVHPLRLVMVSSLI